MSNVVIRVENASKLYQIGTYEQTDSIREFLTATATAPLRRFKERKALGNQQEGAASFWALRDISFEVRQGEVVGLVGRNGAGKSTLLKILSRITGLTGGRVDIYGRIGSLLEVGTGFHPELTGRENVFMNGAILGMSRREIQSKFDEIVAFSEVEKFIDTPVKRYSSGMHTRLAFSVAAHLEPEVMIVDEVLAVGDAAFQQKCVGKMNQVAGEGRTVLFVSHNMAAVESLCSRVILLKDGQVEFDGNTLDGIRRYHEVGGSTQDQGVYVAPEESIGLAPFQLVRASIGNDEGPTPDLAIGAPLVFTLECQSRDLMVRPNMAIGIDDKRGTRIVTFHTKCTPSLPAQNVQGKFRLVCRVPDVALQPGQYRVTIGADHDGMQNSRVEANFGFTVLPTDYFNNAGKRVRGVILAPQEWRLETDS